MSYTTVLGQPRDGGEAYTQCRFGKDINILRYIPTNNIGKSIYFQDNNAMAALRA